jgi:hypothetical protein
MRAYVMKVWGRKKKNLVRFKSLGCWKDTHKRAVPIVIGRSHTPASCARIAAARGMNTFVI